MSQHDGPGKRLLDGLWRRYLDDPAFAAVLSRDLQDGQHRNPDGRAAWFTTAYFHLPVDLAEEVDAAGLQLEALLEVEVPGWLAPDFEARWQDDLRRQQFLESIARVERPPRMLGVSAHLLATARHLGQRLATSTPHSDQESAGRILDKSLPAGNPAVTPRAGRECGAIAMCLAAAGQEHGA